MTLTPLIAVHLTTAVAAAAIGPIAIWARRPGSLAKVRLHRAAGYAFTTLMLCAAISAIFIRDFDLLNWHGYTFIHILIPLTLLGLFGAFRCLLRGDIAGHRRAMLQVYVGACLVAGLFAFWPGRFLNQWLSQLLS